MTEYAVELTDDALTAITEHCGRYGSWDYATVIGFLNLPTFRTIRMRSTARRRAPMASRCEAHRAEWLAP